MLKSCAKIDNDGTIKTIFFWHFKTHLKGRLHIKKNLSSFGTYFLRHLYIVVAGAGLLMEKYDKNGHICTIKHTWIHIELGKKLTQNILIHLCRKQTDEKIVLYLCIPPKKKRLELSYSVTNESSHIKKQISSQAGNGNLLFGNPHPTTMKTTLPTTAAPCCGLTKK